MIFSCWIISADYMQGTRLSFRTKEDAIHFAEKQGEYHIVVCSTFDSPRLQHRMGLLHVRQLDLLSNPLADIWYHSSSPERTHIPPKNYAENYVYKPNKLRIMRTK